LSALPFVIATVVEVEEGEPALGTFMLNVPAQIPINFAVSSVTVFLQDVIKEIQIITPIISLKFFMRNVFFGIFVFIRFVLLIKINKQSETFDKELK